MPQSLKIIVICFFQFDYVLLERSVEKILIFPSCCGLIQVENSISSYNDHVQVSIVSNHFQDNISNEVKF